MKTFHIALFALLLSIAGGQAFAHGHGGHGHEHGRAVQVHDGHGGPNACETSHTCTK